MEDNTMKFAQNRVNVIIKWKKKNNSKTHYTFIDSFESYRGALTSLLNVKGGFEKINIISIQDYDRNLQECKNDPILAEDEDGIISQMYKEWEENNTK